MAKVLNNAEKKIGTMSYENAKNKQACGSFLNRYERMLRDKQLDEQKRENKELKFN